MDVHVTDFVTIGLLVVLEGLLSADNALVLAILVLGLPRGQQQKALRYGIVGAFVFRTLAVVLALQLLAVPWVKLIGGLYLLYLVWQHFFGAGDDSGGRRAIKPATDLVFAVDSILVAVAMSPKRWVVITGGLLGIVAMRLVIGQLLKIVRRYPALVDAAFVIIAWVAIKLLVEYANVMGWTSIHISKWLSFGLIFVIFGAGYLYARRQGPVEDEDARPGEGAALFEEPPERG